MINDAEHYIREIRRLKTDQFYTDTQIMEAMKISRGTFYKYKRIMYEQTEKFLEFRRAGEIEEAINVMNDQLEWVGQKLKSIAETAELDSDRIKALDSLKDLIVGKTKISAQERDEVLKQYGHFNKQEKPAVTQGLQASQ